MKNMLRKILAVSVVALLLLCTVTGSILAVSAETEEIIVLYTNDVHCGTDNYAVFAAYRAQLISEGYNVVTIDAGDALQGEMIGALTEGQAIVDIMNSVGYDYAVPGNHEFDYTVETFLDLANNNAEYQYICANFRDLIEEKEVFEPYVIRDFGDEKIAFVGIATPETYSKSTPTYFQDENGNFIYGFMGDSLYETVQTAIDNAVSDGATKVIAVGHLGISGVTEGWRSTDVIANTIGIDAFIDGHAHEVIEGDIYKNLQNEETILSSTGTKFENFGKLTISSDGSIKTELIDPDTINIDTFSAEAKSAYLAVKSKIDAYNAEFEYLFEEIGTSDAYLTQNDADGNRLVRCGETNLGDFVTDAYVAVTGADIGFVNGGGIRSEINKGTVTRKNIMDINPWGNEMCVIEASGQQIIDALEYGMSAYPEEFGSFPHVSGISFEVHTYIESPVITNELGDFVSIRENAQRRVTNVRVGGEEIDLDKTYTIAGSCYMLQLSGFKMFTGAKTVEYMGPKTDSEMLVEYFEKHLNGKITAEQYGNISGAGRIVMVDKAPENVPPAAGDGSMNIVWVTLLAFAAATATATAKKRK